MVVNYFEDDAGINGELAQAVVDQLGSRATACAADVREPEAVGEMFDKAVAEFGGVDIVVANAAVLRDRTIAKMSQLEWQAVIDTNLTGVFNTCQAAAAKMNDGGRIINMASIAGVVGFFGQANYSAAKAGVIGLTKVLSRELARRQITVNAIAPGVALTEMGKTIPVEVRERMLAQIPLGRFAETEEIAKIVLFLASDLASYVTGQTIHVNGGWFG